MSRHLVADKRELADGAMKQVTAGNTEVLLVQLRGQVHALYAHCTHYGAPLAEGILSGSRLVCPWHHACFSIETGNLLEPPALDALPRFDVMVDGDDVWVELPEADRVSKTRTSEMATPDTSDPRVFVVLGAGAAGAAAVETLRQDGFRGRVVLVTQEDDLPYDRTLLSKDYLSEGKTMGWIPLRERAFFETHGIEVRTGHQVTRLDTAGQTLTFQDRSSLHYDKLLLATGSTPVPLEVPGTELDGVMYLRTFGDGQMLLERAKEGDRVVVVGSSFIGMECASSLTERGLAVTVVTPDAVPFERLLGDEVGGMFKVLHEENGVTFAFSSRVAQIVGEERVAAVVLDDGHTLDADLVVIGIGVEPATNWLEGMAKSEDGSVTVDRFLRLGNDHGRLYAAGDLARYPDPVSGERIRVEHWRLAMQHGRTAAHNMAGRDVPFGGVPLFWTKQHGVGLRYVGHAPEWDEVVIDGNLEERDFLAYYFKGDRVLAVLGAQRDAELCVIEECMRLNEMPGAGEIRDHSVDWQAQFALTLGTVSESAFENEL